MQKYQDKPFLTPSDFKPIPDIHEKLETDHLYSSRLNKRFEMSDNYLSFPPLSPVLTSPKKDNDFDFFNHLETNNDPIKKNEYSNDRCLMITHANHPGYMYNPYQKNDLFLKSEVSRSFKDNDYLNVHHTSHRNSRQPSSNVQQYHNKYIERRPWSQYNVGKLAENNGFASFSEMDFINKISPPMSNRFQREIKGRNNLNSTERDLIDRAVQERCERVSRNKTTHSYKEDNLKEPIKKQRNATVTLGESPFPKRKSLRKSYENELMSDDLITMQKTKVGKPNIFQDASNIKPISLKKLSDPINKESNNTSPVSNVSFQQVVGSFSIDPTHFYVHRVEDEQGLVHVQDMINHWLSITSPVCDVEIGKLYIAKYSVDGTWYRAIVRNIDRCEMNALMFYIDYGNEEYVSFTNMRYSMPYYSIDKYPPFAYRCKLYDIKPVDNDDWSKTCIQKFSAIIHECILHLIIIKEELMADGNHLYSVDLRRYSQCLGIFSNIPVSVREILVIHGFGICNDVPFNYLAKKKVSRCIPFIEPCIEFGSKFVPVIIRKFRSPQNFTLSMASEESTYRNMMNDLQIYTDTITNKYDFKVLLPQVNMPCIVWCESNNQWYRAIILEVQSDRKVLVNYIDIQMKATVSFDNLRKISEQLMTHQMYAIKCCLRGVSTKPEVEKYSDKMKEVVKKFILDSESNISSRFYKFEDDHFVVELYGKYDGITNDLGSCLINEGTTGPTEKSLNENANKQSRLSNVLQWLQPLSINPNTTENNTINQEDSDYVELFANLKLGKHYDVNILHVDSPTRIFVSLKSTEDSFNMLSLLTEGIITDVQANPKKYNIYLMQRSSNFEKVLVLDINKDHVKVLFIDRGGFGDCLKSNLYELPECMKRKKIITFIISLYGLLPTCGQMEFSKTAFQSIKEIVSINKKWVVYCRKNAQLYSKLWNLPVYEADLLWKVDIVGGPFELNAEKFYNLNLSLIDKGVALPNKTDDLDALPLPKKFSLIYQTKFGDCNFMPLNNEIFSTWRPPKLLDQSYQYCVIPTYVDDKGFIYFHLEEDAESLNILGEYIFKQLDASFTSAEHSWSIGDAVMVRFHLDRKWYRGTVVEMLEYGKASVYFIDYGNIETVDYCDLRSDIHYPDIPTYCTKSILTELIPTSKKILQQKDLDFLHQMIVLQKCFITVCSFNTEENCIEIRMTRIEENRNINNFVRELIE